MQRGIIDSADFQGAGLARGFEDNEKILANGFFCRLLVALHGWLHFVAGEVIPLTGHDEQLSRLREFGWSLLEQIWSAEIPSSATLNPPLHSNLISMEETVVAVNPLRLTICSIGIGT